MLLQEGQRNQSKETSRSGPSRSGESHNFKGERLGFIAHIREKLQLCKLKPSVWTIVKLQAFSLKGGLSQLQDFTRTFWQNIRFATALPAPCFLISVFHTMGLAYLPASVWRKARVIAIQLIPFCHRPKSLAESATQTISCLDVQAGSLTFTGTSRQSET